MTECSARVSVVDGALVFHVPDPAGQRIQDGRKPRGGGSVTALRPFLNPCLVTVGPVSARVTLAAGRPGPFDRVIHSRWVSDGTSVEINPINTNRLAVDYILRAELYPSGILRTDAGQLTRLAYLPPRTPHASATELPMSTCRQVTP